MNLKATVQGLHTQLSDAQGLSQKLTKRLDETSEAANQHKLEAERVKAVFDDFKAKHETELAQAQKPVIADPETVPKSRTCGIGIEVFESWMQDRSITANTAFLEETDGSSTSEYNAVAYTAFAQARSRNWSAAYEEAQKVTILCLDIRLSLTNARTVGQHPTVGDRTYRKGRRTCWPERLQSCNAGVCSRFSRRGSK